MASRPVRHKNGGQTLHKDGGQALDPSTITLKTDSNRPMHREFCKTQNISPYTELKVEGHILNVKYCEENSGQNEIQ